MKQVVDFLFAPTTRLMGRLRFAWKLGLIGAILLITISVFSTVLVSGINAQIRGADGERVAITAVTSVRELLDAVQAHQALSARLQAGDKSVAGSLAAATTSADNAFDVLKLWSGAAGIRFGLGNSVAVAHKLWEPLRQVGAIKDPKILAQDYQKLHEGIGSLLKTIADRSGLTLDPEMESNYLLASMVGHLPVLLGVDAQLRDVGSTVIGNGVMFANDRSSLTSLTYIADRELFEMNEQLGGVLASDPAAAQELGPELQVQQKSAAVYLDMLRKSILGVSSIDLPEASFDRAASDAITGVLKLLDSTTGVFENRLDLRLDGLRFKRFSTMAACFGSLLLATYLFAGFTRSMRDSLRHIGDAVEGMASGRFPDRVPVATRDELREVADGMESVAATLRGFAAAQKEIYKRHQAGEIGFRIAAGQFRGSYADMVSGVNQLSDEHGAITDTVVGIIQKYADGDLSARIERLPGEQARISDAVDGVRECLTAIHAEILSLSAAAANGDFDRRGDADRFKFAYREIIEGLNQLMTNAESGLSEVGRLLEGLAQGDLTRRMDGRFEGQFARLQVDANGTVEQISHIVRSIKNSSATIDTAAKEIAAGNAELSVRTEQQAAGLEETASSMEELTSTVKANAESAGQANQLAQGSGAVAAQGGAVMVKVVETMSEIKTSSSQIADIIGVIDGIAFQTNILALNAAVEAARAGDQGRGFAVVASEVRSLARRSAEAAKEIKALIKTSSERVAVGSQLVAQAGKTMEEIVVSVKRVTDIMAEITAASHEQRAGIEQVNRSIAQMDDTTQQNAALVEEASASATSLEHQAGALWHAVEAFQVRDDDSAARRTQKKTMTVKGERSQPIPVGRSNLKTAIGAQSRPARPLNRG